MPECTQQHDELIDDIETYMYLHPEHKINADDFAGNDFLTFLGLREEYWMGRCMESGACSAIGNRDVQNLMDYYDFHLPVTTTVFDPARIDWTATGLDGAGLVLSVVALSAAPQAAQGYLAASRTAGAISMGRSFAIGDNAGGWLSFAGYAPVPIGTLASGASVFRDVSAGFYDVPYAPPVPR